MKIGIKFQGIKVDGDVIIHGHHRYLTSMLAGVTLDRLPSNKTAATVVSDWTAVVFDSEDWDTPAKIKMLNEQDAKYNLISIDKINKLITE